MWVGSRVRELLATDESGEPLDTPVPQSLGQACVRVLAAWDWGETGRPETVLTVPSPVRPTLARSLGEGLAHVGKLVYLGEAELAAEPRFFGGNSVFRCADVMRSYQIPPEVIERLREHPGPVLLVSDIVDSRWSITVFGAAAAGGRSLRRIPLRAGCDTLRIVFLMRNI